MRSLSLRVLADARSTLASVNSSPTISLDAMVVLPVPAPSLSGPRDARMSDGVPRRYNARLCRHGNGAHGPLYSTVTDFARLRG